jgi:hypothetical protein
MFNINEDWVWIMDTEGLLTLAENAEKINGNRQANLDALRANVDPAGCHLLTFQMLHNDCEWRTAWLIKVKDRDEPVDLWLDVDLDILETKREKRLTGIGGLKIMGGEKVQGWP